MLLISVMRARGAIVFMTSSDGVICTDSIALELGQRYRSAPV
jgi:hypothetical protein